MKHFLFIFLFLIPHSALAEGVASLSLSPATSTFPVGDVFRISVNVDTGGKLINTAEGKIGFNKEDLEVVGVFTDGSILGSWVTAPSYSNEEGTISFGGSVAGGFMGDSGKILSIDFHALKNTEAKVHFSAGAAILATEGNILSVMNAGAYTLVPKEVIPIIEPPAKEKGLVLGASTSTESKMLITSVSHSDENKWYKEKTAKFAWTLPPEVIALRLLADSASSTIPTKLYNPPISEKIITDVHDGISYFHLQTKTLFGWGEPIHYRFQTDTENPDTFHISEASTDDTFGFLFKANDKISGIEKYLVQIDNENEAEWKDDGSHTYIHEAMEPGSHTLLAKAVDFAGNFATSSIAFALESVPTPSITDFEAKLLPGAPLVVRGKAEPNAAVIVFVREPGSERTFENKVTSGQDGKFTFVLNRKTEVGVYEITAETVGRGVRSTLSESALITVSEPGIILFGKQAVEYLTVLIPLVALVLLLIFILVFGWHQFGTFRKKLQKEIEEVEAVSHESFEGLRKEIYEDERILAALDSPEEKTKESKRKETVARLKKSVDIAEEKIEKEITVVKEEVKKSSKVKAKRVG